MRLTTSSFMESVSFAKFTILLSIWIVLFRPPDELPFREIFSILLRVEFIALLIVMEFVNPSSLSV